MTGWRETPMKVNVSDIGNNFQRISNHLCCAAMIVLHMDGAIEMVTTVQK